MGRVWLVMARNEDPVVFSTEKLAEEYAAHLNQSPHGGDYGVVPFDVDPERWSWPGAFRVTVHEHGHTLDTWWTTIDGPAERPYAHPQNRPRDPSPHPMVFVGYGSTSGAAHTAAEELRQKWLRGEVKP